MKKKLKLFILLVTTIFGTLGLANKTLFQTVKATYVEGSITQDTIWTLVDSPFVVSKNITVYPNVTLTIEPGVEVRFGGTFSLTVLGKLYANGTEKAIWFTSNEEQPNPGDWNTIRFNGTEKSMLVGCFVAYATDGMLIETGDVEIENTQISLCSQNGINAVNSKLRIQASTVSYCSQNGINAENSEVIAQDNMIMDNGGNGIVIIGNRQVAIQRNIIIANKNGILLIGNEISTVNISQNVVAANEQNGIQLNVDNFTNLVIIHNNVSSNHMGFYISSRTSTYITNNSISYNGIGIFYEEGNHTAYFNDIYSNEKGMDVAFLANVVAEYNYWGHESGPYHESLNPSGKGNPVGGNGVNLDFIFFSTEPFGYINARPISTLLTDKTLVPPNKIVTFFATNSLDEGRIDRYFFDFGDGGNSGWTTLSIFTHEYSSPGIHNASLIVMDDYGATSSDSAKVTIDVQDLPLLYVNIDLGDHMAYESEQVPITVYVTNGIVAMEDAKVTLFSVTSGDFMNPVGYTNSTGYFTTTFTTPNVSCITSVRIMVTASKSGYADGSDYEYLEASPSFSVQVMADRDLVRSEETTLVSVYVKSNEQPVAGALVSAYSDGGKISNEAGITDSDGIFLLNFTAPQTTVVLNITITATVAKIGYMNKTGQTMISVEPRGTGETGGGWPLTTILLIVIPIVVVVIIVVLVKLRIITFSTEEES